MASFVTACVTGTNGKTTTTTMIAAIVAASGETAARITTLGAWVGERKVANDATSSAFERTIEAARAAGVRHLAIETTSQALADGFAASWPADVAVFTNLSRDHLDAHGTPEAYLAAKAQLFVRMRSSGVAVLNASDPASSLLAEVVASGARIAGYAARAIDPACVAIPLALGATSVRVDAGGTSIDLAPSPLADRLGGALHLAVVGDVHAENALAAAVAADAMGIDAAAILRGLASFRGVPGRFEIVARAPLAVVDYAHTPDGLERTLALARRLVPGRVICVFGCGGERDPGKRAEMGKIAGKRADRVIVTTDNPRSEDPATIAAAVERGLEEANGSFTRMLSRRDAIFAAAAEARPDDVVIVAGKGHETVQIIGDTEIKFDDAGTLRAAIAGRETGR